MGVAKGWVARPERSDERGGAGTGYLTTPCHALRHRSDGGPKGSGRATLLAVQDSTLEYLLSTEATSPINPCE